MQLPEDDLRIETCWSDFKCFNVKILCMCISWCADYMTVRNARRNHKDNKKNFAYFNFYTPGEKTCQWSWKLFVHPNSRFDAPTIRHTPKHLLLSICVWPLSMFHCSVTLGSESCFAISGVDRPV